MVDILYPPRCPICDKIIDSKQLSCSGCIRTLKYVGRVRCMKCGKSMDGEEKEYCYDCMKKEHLYDSNIALWEYNDMIKQSIYRFKYHNQRSYAKFYADEIFRRYEKVIASYEAQAIIPVPLHGSKLKLRGYNQSALIAKEIAVLANLKFDDTFLIRSKKTLPQKELSDIQRFNNLENAFKISHNGVKYNKVILFDDIYTTGATLDECTRALKGAGVENVYAICLCIGRGF